MRSILLGGFASALLILPALAQPAPTPSQLPPDHSIMTQAPAVPTSPKGVSPAVNPAPDMSSTTADGLAGANSFTEGQAHSRLEKDGFSNISELTKDKNGIWRGRASKAAKELEVGVDYKGNIIAN